MGDPQTQSDHGKSFWAFISPILVIVSLSLVIAVFLKGAPARGGEVGEVIDNVLTIKNAAGEGKYMSDFSFDVKEGVTYLEFYSYYKKEDITTEFLEENTHSGLSGEVFKVYNIKLDIKERSLTRDDILQNKNKLIKFKVSDEFRKDKEVTLAYYKAYSKKWISKVTSYSDGEYESSGFEGPGIYAIVGFSLK